MKRKRRAAAALILALCMVFTLLPGAVFADSGNTMTFGEFVQELEEGNGTFDGEGVTVKWEPDESVDIIHRVQEPNAQYQLLSGMDVDVKISNTNFEYVPADIPNHSDGWNGLNKDWTKYQIRNAEFQFLNTGDVTVENCNFDKIIVSPYGPGDKVDMNTGRSTSISGCSFSNVYNAYALKDIYTDSATISNNRFDNCSGAIYFEGSVPRKSIKITGNTFNKIDVYAASGKENTRGIIQFSLACVLNNDTVLEISGSTITGNTVKDASVTDSDTGMPVIRQISDMGVVSVSGWTPGEAFSVKHDADTLGLPSMPSGTVNNVQYDFAGWAKSEDYKGSTDLTNEDSFVQPGEKGVLGFYYAVWKATPQQGTEDPTTPAEPGTTGNDPAGGQGTDKNVKTDDPFGMAPWIVLMCAAGAAGISLILYSGKKKSRKTN